MWTRDVCHHPGLFIGFYCTCLLRLENALCLPEFNVSLQLTGGAAEEARIGHEVTAQRPLGTEKRRKPGIIHLNREAAKKKSKLNKIKTNKLTNKLTTALKAKQIYIFNYCIFLHFQKDFHRYSSARLWGLFFYYTSMNSPLVNVSLQLSFGFKASLFTVSYGHKYLSNI